MQADKPYRRKLLNFSIKRDMQFKMIGKIFLLLFVSLLLSGLIFYQFANQEVTSSFQMFHIKALNFLDFLFPVILSSFGISLVVGTIGSLFFPKPIAGGLYRIEKDLQTVIDKKDLTVQIKLRDGDQMGALASQINTLLSDFRETIQKLDDGLKELKINNDPAAGLKIQEHLRKEISQLKTSGQLPSLHRR